jgi:tetratricopeptide (TPR) repeat protein
MKVDILESIEELLSVKNRWSLVYQSDPCAQFFVSWIWIFGCLKWQDNRQNPWLILAAKPDAIKSDYVAFFPLCLVIENDNDLGLYTQLQMAGITDSHYSGFICMPEYEIEVTKAFARHLQDQEVWSVFELQHIPEDSFRICQLLKHFAVNRFRISEIHNLIYRDKLDEIDNSICPYINLPETWEIYLQQLGSSTRKNLRKKLKRFSQQKENSDRYRIALASEDNVDQYLDILLNLWKDTWKIRKGEKHCSAVKENWRFLLYYCFEHQVLYLPVLWYDDRPVGAIAHFIDRPRKALLSFLSARDENLSDLSPGLILHAEAIRYGIQNGFKVYDFLMGNEAYKYSLGAQERHIKTFLVHRKRLIHQEEAINLRNVPKAITIAELYHQKNQLSAAQKRYEQILASHPKNSTAIYNLAVVMQRQENYLAAEVLLKQLLDQQPVNSKVWFSLGTLYQQQGKLSKAIDTYEQALKICPNADMTTLGIYLNLGYALQQQGDLRGAVEYYQKAKALDPACAEAAAMWANAQEVQGQLSSDDKEVYAALNYELGHKRWQSGDLKAALEYFRQTIVLNPTWADAYYSLGMILHESKEGEWTEIIALYQKAHELTPDSAEVDVSLAHALFAQGKLSMKEQVLYAACSYDLGNHYKNLRDWNMAAYFYRKAIDLKSDCPEAYFSLGFVLQQASDSNLDEVVAYYRQAQKLDPNSIKIEVSLANVLFVQGKFPPEKLASYARLNCELAHQYRQAGELELAIAHYQQALSMEPDLAEARTNFRLVLQELSQVQIKVSVAKSGIKL